jgi:hypothetical protein
MFAAIGAFLLVWWVPIFILLGIIALVTEHNEAHGWTVFFTIVMMLAAVSLPSVTWTMMGVLAVVWVPIGLVWSLWRWKKYCAHIVSEVANGKIMASSGKQMIDPQEALSKITQWVIAWPFSLVESLIGDIIDAVQNMIKGIFKATYEKISAKALVQIESLNK